MQRERDVCVCSFKMHFLSILPFRFFRLHGTASFTEKAAPMAATSALPAECNRGIGLGRLVRTWI